LSVLLGLTVLVKHSNGVGLPFTVRSLLQNHVSVVSCSSTAGDFTIELDHSWSPLGVARFLELTKAEFFDGQIFYRVVPGFLINFGIAADPSLEAKWSNQKLPDEPKKVKFEHGTLSFAGDGAGARSSRFLIALSPYGARLGAAPSETAIGRVTNPDVLEDIEWSWKEEGYGPLPDLPREMEARGNEAAANYTQLHHLIKCRTEMSEDDMRALKQRKRPPETPQADTVSTGVQVNAVQVSSVIDMARNGLEAVGLRRSAREEENAREEEEENAREQNVPQEQRYFHDEHDEDKARPDDEAGSQIPGPWESLIGKRRPDEVIGVVLFCVIFIVALRRFLSCDPEHNLNSKHEL